MEPLTKTFRDFRTGLKNRHIEDQPPDDDHQQKTISKYVRKRMALHSVTGKSVHRESGLSAWKLGKYRSGLWSRRREWSRSRESRSHPGWIDRGGELGSTVVAGAEAPLKKDGEGAPPCWLDVPV